MKLKEENIKKLREGDATLVADHSKLDMMDKVLKNAFPNDNDTFNDLKYYFSNKISNLEWYACNQETKGELIPLADFFEIEQSYKPKTAEERDKLVKELQEMKFNMTVKEAVKILKLHNDWRRGEEIDMQNIEEIGKAIDIAVRELEKQLNKYINEQN